MTALISDPKAKPFTIPLAVWPDLLDELEATDVVLGTDQEHVDVGPISPEATYLRFVAPDLLVATDRVRRILDQIEEAVLDARQEAAHAAMHECPGCPTRLEAEERTCGAASCDRVLAAEAAL